MPLPRTLERVYTTTHSRKKTPDHEHDCIVHAVRTYDRREEKSLRSTYYY